MGALIIQNYRCIFAAAKKEEGGRGGSRLERVRREMSCGNLG